MRSIWKYPLSLGLTALLFAAFAHIETLAAAPGRYKAGAKGQCVWDPNDSGPDQCKPVEKRGRFKQEGNKCVWDPNDSGPNQCEPPRK